MEAVEVDRVRVLTVVLKHNAQPFPFGGPQRRPRHLPVVGPRWVVHPRRNLDLYLFGRDLVLPYGPPAILVLLSPVEVPQKRGWIKPGGVHTPRRFVPSVRAVLGPCEAHLPTLLLTPLGRAGVGSQERAGESQRSCHLQESPTGKAMPLYVSHSQLLSARQESFKCLAKAKIAQ